MTPQQIASSLGGVFFLVLLNGFFVAAEFALVTVRRTRIDQMVAEGNASAAVVQKAIRGLDRFIAATQIGVTVASLVLGAQGEKAFHAIFEPLLSFIPEGEHAFSRGFVAVGLAYLVMTSLHVIVGELMPKSIRHSQNRGRGLVHRAPDAGLSCAWFRL